MKTILYIHGMGGGADSRIPSILSERLKGQYNVVVRTYDFDPEKAVEQVSQWCRELSPDLVIGESLGAYHALRVKGVPHLLVSPALGAAKWFSIISPLTVLKPFRLWLNRHFKPRRENRQELDFRHSVLKRYRAHKKAAFANTKSCGSKDYFFAFFGTDDHYRRFGVVSLPLYRKLFPGDSYAIYKGTHFMENEHVETILVKKIKEVLG